MIRVCLVFLILFSCHGCFVSGICQSDDDCDGAQVCESGSCTFQCHIDDDCNRDQQCSSNRCLPADGCLGCPYPDAPQGTGDCLHGVCSIVGCDEGWHDADKDAQNGCECETTNEGNEICDGKDNDCNGLTDEGCDCTPSNGGVEICDGKDNDCDYLVDEDLLCCPEEMAGIDDSFCMDRYEASRADATDVSYGVDDDSAPQSVADVMPWRSISVFDAAKACNRANKRLCNPAEMLKACMGAKKTDYCYGSEYIADACNGIDAFCSVPQYGCGLEERPFRLTMTGQFPDCENGFGVYDINGNLWEWDSDASGQAHGGAYNCSDSLILHKCDYIRRDGADPINNVGFRCCK